MSDHQPLTIPDKWTFKSESVAENFDQHVREQLPWYDLVTSSVAHIARHYIPRGGVVYDIGASTGNIGNAIRDTLDDRRCEFVAIEESEQMAQHYQGPEKLIVADALKFEYKPFDFAICFLLLMFLPVRERFEFVFRLRDLLQPGGAIVIVDKIVRPAGYFDTCMRRLAMRWKLEAGASAEDVLRKELSLAGYQRPLNPSAFAPFAQQWFLFGEFAGWVIEFEEGIAPTTG